MLISEPAQHQEVVPFRQALHIFGHPEVVVVRQADAIQPSLLGAINQIIGADKAVVRSRIGMGMQVNIQNKLQRWEGRCQSPTH